MRLLSVLKQQGRSLVLTGPASCGKTLLAKQLAAEEGKYLTIDITRVVGDKADFNWLMCSPTVVIVEGFPEAKHLSELKGVLTSSSLWCNRKNTVGATIKTPMFIFCTVKCLISLSNIDRRFYFLSMDSEVEA